MGVFGLHLPKKVDNVLGGVGRQLNPFDNGRTYKQQTPTNNRSLVGQVTHNGLTNFVGNAVVKPAVQFGVGSSNILYNDLVAPTFNLPQQNIPRVGAINPTVGKLAKFSGATGSGWQTLGSGLVTGLNIAAPGSSKLVEGAAARVLPKAAPGVVRVVAPKVAGGVAVGTPFGAAANTGSYLTSTPNPTFAGARHAAAQGAEFGAALGAGIPVAGLAAKGTVKVGQKAYENRTPLNQTGAVGKNVDPLDNLRKQLPKGYKVDKTGSVYNPKGKELTAGEIQNLTQPKYLSYFEGASQQGNKEGMRIIAQRYPKDIRVQIKNKELGLPENPLPSSKMASKKGVTVTSTPVTPTVKVAGKGSAKAFDTNAYIRQQLEAQKAAAKADKLSPTIEAKKGFRSKFVDTLAPIEDPIIAAKGRAGELKLRNQLDRSLRANTIAGRYAQDNGLHDVIQNVPNTNEFNQYLLAKHGQDLEANGIKTGRNLGQDQQLIDALGAKYEPHAQALKQYNNGLLDTASNYGLISKETANYLKAKYPNYVPFDRIFTEAEQKLQQGRGKGVASLSTQSVVQKIKGSSRQIQPPLESILSKTQDIVSQGERNRAAQILSTYKDLPGNPLGLRELKASETIGTKPTISFLDNGRKRVFETTPEVAAAAKSLNKEQLGFLSQVFAVPTRVLRLGATSANAAFALANVAKDTISAFINSSHSLRASPANPRVFLLAAKAAGYHGSKEYGELVREAAGGTSFDIARNAAPLTVGRIRAGRNLNYKGVYTVTHPGELLRALENTIGRSEEFNRAVQYFGNKEAALAQGKTEQFAKMYGADAARNNTVNFARAGDYGRVLNTVLPYLNAGFQGSRTLLRNLKNRPAETSAKIAIAGFMPIAAATAWNLSDEKRKRAYDSISEYEKQNNIIIIGPNPKQDASGRWTGIVKIPTSQEIANLNNIVRNGVENLHKDKNFDFASMAGDLIGTTTSLNAQNPHQVAGQLTPQAVKPGVETVLNQNLFTGEQIVPDAIKNLAPQDQISKSTSGTAKVIGRTFGVSPLQVDNAIRTATGGLGQNVIHVTDTALSKTGAIQPSEIRGKSLPTSIAQRFNSAQGQSEASQYFTTLQNTAKQQHLAGADYQQLNSIISKSLDPNGKPRPLNEKDSLEKNRILASSPNIAKVISDSALALAKKRGKEVDPLYKLTPQQQQTYYQIQATPYKSDDYNRLVDKSQAWLPDFQDKRSLFYQRNPLPTGGSHSDKIPYPKFSRNVSNLLDQAGSLEGADRANFISDHPELQDAYNKISKYTNDKRIAQGYDPYKAYPTATPDVQSAIDYYNKLPKGTGARKSWIAAHPDTYAKMQNYYAQSAMWQLANNAGQGKYEGSELNQKALKAAYNLGQYDIFKTPDGTYTINPSASYAASSGGGKGGYGRTKKFATGASKVTSGKKRTARIRVRKSRVSIKKGGSNKLASVGKIKVSSYKSKV